MSSVFGARFAISDKAAADYQVLALNQYSPAFGHHEAGATSTFAQLG